jgi:C-terminal processing protease CtpA/Prc
VALRLSCFLWLTEGTRESFEVTLARSTGNTYREQVAAYAKPRNAVHGERVIKNKEATFPFAFYRDGKICLLQARSFWYTLRKEFTTTLHTVFAQMSERSTTVLVVDLRGNGGGDGELGMDLIRRIAQKPFRTGSKKWRFSKAFQRANLIYGLRERGIPAFLHLENILDLKDCPPYKGTIDPSRIRGEYLTYENTIEQPRKKAWKGTLVLLCDRDTYSAASECATVVKDNRLGIIAGEETGGRASEYAEVAIVYLPNSGLACQISSAHAVRPADYDDGRGVLPDLPLDVTLKDDALMEKICDHLGIK